VRWKYIKFYLPLIGVHTYYLLQVNGANPLSPLHGMEKARMLAFLKFALPPSE